MPSSSRPSGPTPSGGSLRCHVICRVAEPHPEARIRERQQEGPRLGRVDPHRRAGGGARYGQRHAEREAARLASAVRPVFRRRPVAKRAAADVQRGERERLRGHLVASDMRGPHGVERRVDDVQRTHGREVVHAQIVVGVEPCEKIRVAIAPGRAEERANEPLAIHPVQRDAIDRHERAHEEPRDGEDGPKQHDLTEPCARRVARRPMRYHLGGGERCAA